jgi:Mn-dependent DtxR family transcriptional regulator
MIKEILKLLSRGNITFNDLAIELSISQSELKNRLDLLEHMGYIEIICKENPTLESGCLFCSEANECAKNTKSDYFETIYKLTKKGRKVGNAENSQ